MANYQIHLGNNQDILKQYEDGHFDAIVTDPPYGIEFLGKDWDQNTGAVETWRQCLRVLKPGGHLLAFSAARTYHHLASNIEQVGFEIRDQLMWLYASGFPKAQKIKGHTGWKTQLKPAHEPIVMARKPFPGSTYANMDTHGVGALNIDATRIALEKNAINDKTKVEYTDYNFKNAGEGHKQNNLTSKFNPNEKGRYPANVMGEVTGYQKFFYCPKVSRKERHCGFEQEHVVSNTEMLRQMGGHYKGTTGQRQKDEGQDVWLPHCGHIKIHGLKHEYQRWLKQQSKDQSDVGNNHPTVKPVALMRYLINLVVPKNSTILDPFTGSGSTGMAAVELGHKFVGCELDPQYVNIANRRIEGWLRSFSAFHKWFEL